MHFGKVLLVDLIGCMTGGKGMGGDIHVTPSFSLSTRRLMIWTGTGACSSLVRSNSNFFKVAFMDFISAETLSIIVASLLVTSSSRVFALIPHTSPCC